MDSNERFREVTTQTTVPIPTGGQLYLRPRFKSLIEGKAGFVVEPGPCDVGGISELKWIAEHAGLHGMHMARHGTGDGLFGPAALVRVSAIMPGNCTGFELPVGNSGLW